MAKTGPTVGVGARPKLSAQDLIRIKERTEAQKRPEDQYKCGSDPSLNRGKNDGN